MTPKRGEATLEVVGGDAVRVQPQPLPQDSGAEPSLGEYIATIIEFRTLVLGVAAAVLAVGAMYAFAAPRTWRSDVLLQVEEKKSGFAGLSELSSMFSETTPADTEIEILRSRMLVGAVVDELGLDIEAAPRRFPLLGNAVARRYQGEDPAPPRFGFERYGWGGERITVHRLDVPARLENEPLTLVALDGSRFRLLDPDRRLLLEGEVGKLASANGVDLFVQELRARPGTEFRIVDRIREEAIVKLQEDLRIAEKGKKTGIIQVTLDGRDPARIAAILDALSKAYVRQNVDRRSADAQQSLAFIETQLPELRAKLDQAEQAMKDYQARKGQVDLTLETKATVDLAGDVEKQVTMLTLERAALRQRFTEQHPAIVAIDDKLAKLQAQRRSIEDRMKRLPESELESARRMRDVKVTTEMYMALLAKAQELRVAKSGTIGNVRILDAAIVPAKPVSPKVPAVLALSLLLGLGLGIAAAFARRAFDHGADDPDAIERAIRIPIYASIPASQREQDEFRQTERSEHRRPLAVVDPKDLAVESLRSLRTSLQFALVESRNNVVAIGGPAPGIGKSFVAANLAHLVGEAGQKVLVVDADLRRGHLHRVFGGDRARGLAEVIGGGVLLADAIRDTESPNVKFLSSGRIPPNPAELVGSERFERILAEASSQFDLVVLDTPPILAVTDAALAARCAGVTLMVLRAGRHPIREIEAAIRQYTRNGLRVSGLVLNAVALNRGLGRAYAYHYQYKYE
jgi:tyrosine-protein kinase Etk/Wzc